MHTKISLVTRRLVPYVTVLAILLALVGFRLQPVDATCSQAASGAGTVTSTVNIPVTGTYRVWSRIMASSSQNNSYFLEIDNDPCIVVGDNSAISTTAWTWVNYRDGNTSSPISVNLSAGNHTFKMIGRETDVKLDRLIVTTSTTCAGEECASTTDTSPPTVTMTSPAEGSTVSGNITVSASASDDVGVTRVEFYRSGSSTPLSTRTSAPYSFTFNTASVADGAYTFYARAYDEDNATTSTNRSVTIDNIPPEIIAGDTNDDACVNLTDLSVLLSNFGATPATRDKGNVNSDGAIDIFDLSVILSNWGGSGC